MTLARPQELQHQATRIEAIDGRYDRWLLGSVLGLVVLGLVMVTSASMAVAEALGVGEFHFVQRHLLALLLGGVLALVAMRIELKHVERHHLLALVACFILLLLVFVPGLGVQVNGARRWISLLLLNFQVVEAVKLLMVVWLASYLARRRDEVAASLRSMVKPLALVGIMVLLLLAQPDFGSAALLLATAGCMLFLGGASWRKLALIAVPVAILFVLIAVFEPYRLARITSFREPFQDPFGDGYQLVQALIAIGRGEWFGVGLGASVQKLQAFPEVHTDFIFAILSEELGFAGVLFTLALFTVLVGRTFSIGLRCLLLRRQFAGLLALGIGLWIGVQAAVSIGVNLGLLPTKGLTLPFISYGGSSLMMVCAAMGLLLRVSWELDRAERQVQRARGDLDRLDEPGQVILPAQLMTQSGQRGHSGQAVAGRPAKRIEPVLGGWR